MLFSLLLECTTIYGQAQRISFFKICNYYFLEFITANARSSTTEIIVALIAYDNTYLYAYQKFVLAARMENTVFLFLLLLLDFISNISFLFFL